MTILLRAYGSGKEDSPMCDVPGFENCRMKLLRHVSFVDCPVRFLCGPLLLLTTTFVSSQPFDNFCQDTEMSILSLLSSHILDFLVTLNHIFITK